MLLGEEERDVVSLEASILGSIRDIFQYDLRVIVSSAIPSVVGASDLPVLYCLGRNLVLALLC